jgi:hypothetical protein
MARRTDRNHAETMDVLRRLGFLVEDLSQLGDGVPDLMVGTPWAFLVLLEVKCVEGEADGDLTRLLTPKQKGWHLRWRRMPVFVVSGPRDAVEQLNDHRDRHFEEMEKTLERWRRFK